MYVVEIYWVGDVSAPERVECDEINNRVDEITLISDGGKTTYILNKKHIAAMIIRKTNGG